MNTTRRILTLALAAGLPITSAHATDLNWLNAVSGLASSAARWNPAQVPTAADNLFFNVAGPTNTAYTVTFDFSSQNSNSMRIAEDVVSFNILNGHGTGLLQVGVDGTPSPTLSVINGSLSANGGIAIASTTNSVGATINVTGPDALLATGGNTSMSIGSQGQGVMNVLSGATALSVGSIVIGSSSVSNGLVVVTGSLTPPATINTSRLQTSPTFSGDCIVGASGTGELRLGGFSSTSISRDLIVGQNSTSTGTVLVTGGSTVISRDALIGGNIPATAAGNGSMTLSGGTVTVTGQTAVGDVNGGSGLLAISGGTLTTTNFALLPGGLLAHSGGTLIVNGTFSNGLTSLTVNSASGSPTLDLRGSFSNAFPAAVSAITIGSTGNATLVLRQGRSLSATSGSVTIGGGSTANGTLALDTGASLNTGSSTFLVGNAGDGALTVAGASSVNSASVLLASSATASGAITVSGAGSSLSATNSAAARIDIGYNSTANNNAGAGSLTVLNGAVVTSATSITTGGEDDTLDVVDSTLSAGTLIEVRSDTGTQSCLLSNATINANEFRLINGNASLSGTINGRFSSGSGSSQLTLNGNLTAGNASSTVGFFAVGTTIVGPHNLIMRDAAGASAGSAVTIAGGSVRCDTGIINFAGASISGFGTLIGRVQNLGTITATGSGITINGILEGSGTGVSGTHFTFGSTGGFTGAGAISAEVLANAGSVITATGTLSMGDPGAINGFISNGLIVVGSNTVTLLDNGGASVQDVTLNAGSLLGPSTNILINGTIAGSGTLGGLNRTVSVRAAGSRMEPNGTFQVLGPYAQTVTPSTSGGTLEINITSVAGFDRVQIAQSATLGGVLEGGLVPGGSLAIGDRIPFMTFASRSGTFQSVNVPGFHIEYFPTRVDLVFDGLPCDPDVNQDGNTDQDDVTYLINVVGGGANPAVADPDFNHDGNADQDDVLALINVVAGGPCP